MAFPDPSRILVCRLSALGDCVHTMPLVCALRRQFPAAYIAWLTQTRSAPLIAGHEDVDELIAVERTYLRSPRKVASLRHALRARRFDLAIDPQSLTKSALAGWFSGAKMRIGFAPPQGREAAPWLNNVAVRPENLHAVDRTLELLRPLGIEHPDVEFKLPVDRAAKDKIHGLLGALIGEPAPVVMHPGASWPSKLWPHRRYAEVAAHLGERYGMPTVVPWAGETMRRWANEIAQQSRGHAVVAPALTLPELVALLSQARLYVGSDSGPLHMAAALNVPTVSMYGPTLPDHNGPYRQGHCALQVDYQQGSTRARKKAANTAMQAISAARVITACAQMLDFAERRPQLAAC